MSDCMSCVCVNRLRQTAPTADLWLVEAEGGLSAHNKLLVLRIFQIIDCEPADGRVSPAELFQALPTDHSKGWCNLHPLVYNKSTMAKLYRHLKGWDFMYHHEWVSCWEAFEREEGLGSCCLHLETIWRQCQEEGIGVTLEPCVS